MEQNNSTKVITMNVVNEGMSLWVVDDMMNLSLGTVKSSKTGVTGRLIVEFADGRVAMLKETLVNDKPAEALIVLRHDAQCTGFVSLDRKGAERGVDRVYNMSVSVQEAFIEAAQMAINDLNDQRTGIIKWLDDFDTAENINENTDDDDNIEL